MTTKNTIYILWEEPQAQDFSEEYIGGGCFSAHATFQTVTRRCRWSSEATPDLMARAVAYIEENMQDDRQNVRAEIVAEQEKPERQTRNPNP